MNSALAKYGGHIGRSVGIMTRDRTIGRIVVIEVTNVLVESIKAEEVWILRQAADGLLDTLRGGK